MTDDEKPIICDVLKDDLEHYPNRSELTQLLNDHNLISEVYDPDNLDHSLLHNLSHSILYYITNSYNKPVYEKILEDRKIEIAKANLSIFGNDQIANLINNLFLSDIEDDPQDETDYLITIISSYNTSITDLRYSCLRSIINGEYTLAFIQIRIIVELFLKLIFFGSLSISEIRTKSTVQHKGRQISKKNLKDFIENYEENGEFDREDIISMLAEFGLYSKLECKNRHNHKRLEDCETDNFSTIYRNCNNYIHQSSKYTDIIISNQGEYFPKFGININFEIVDQLLNIIQDLNDLISSNFTKLYSEALFLDNKKEIVEDVKNGIISDFSIDKNNLKIKLMRYCNLNRTIQSLYDFKTNLNRFIKGVI